MKISRRCRSGAVDGAPLTSVCFDYPNCCGRGMLGDVKYQHPLPPGLTEPDPSEVTIEAFQGLIGSTFGTWSDERLLAEAEYHEALAIRSGDHVRGEDVLLRRASEMAAHFLRSAWTARQKANVSRGPRDGESR